MINSIPILNEEAVLNITASLDIIVFYKNNSIVYQLLVA